mmetsp:Transcript_5831/g.8997  ORF Transcript_5831/g.8997 Transcript_5831/m.8997 type:complete len:351 (-) Transcript_5831:3003-4055(-)
MLIPLPITTTIRTTIHTASSSSSTFQHHCPYPLPHRVFPLHSSFPHKCISKKHTPPLSSSTTTTLLWGVCPPNNEHENEDPSYSSFHSTPLPKQPQEDVIDPPLSQHPNPIQLELQQERQQRQYGIMAGGSFMILSFVGGCVLGIFPPFVLVMVLSFLLGGSWWYVESSNEYNHPLQEDDYFQVQESTLEGAGKGLFVKSSSNPIPSHTFLFEYTGEILSETEYFTRYPQGNGRYVAEVPSLWWGGEEPLYIDGIDPTKSGIARYMNSQPSPHANVKWKKQSSGSQAGRMFFYSIRDIQPTEELFFDYGDNYWHVVATAQEEQPQQYQPQPHHDDDNDDDDDDRTTTLFS